MLIASGPDGINKVIDKFIEKFSNYSKRQVEIKINEIAVKEKREDDNIKVWHIKPEFEYFLHMEEKAPSPSAAPAAPPADRKKPGPKKKVKTEGEGGDDGGEKNEESKEKSVKKEKTVKPKKEKDESEAHESAPKVTPAKRKAVEANIDTNNLDDDIPSPPPTTPGTAKEPKKSKSAFGLFVKSKRSEAEAKLSSGASVSEICLNCFPFIGYLLFIFPRMIN
jgi:hypothetical protein